MLSTKGMDLALLLLRVVFGASMIIGHGWGKMMRLFSGDPIKFADPFGLGPTTSLILVVFAEVLCAALIIFGLFTRWATVPLIIAMLVAIFMVHLGDPFSKVEKALLFVGAFTAILLAGPGYYSLDAQWRDRVA